MFAKYINFELKNGRLARKLVIFPSSCIYAEKDEKEDCKTPERRATIAEERERDANNRAKSDNHADIDAEVKNEIRGNTIGVYTSESRWLPLGNADDAKN